MSANPPPVSPAGSLQGYSIKVWLSRNKEQIKGAVSIVCGIGMSYLGLIKDPTLNVALAGLAGVITKLLLDLVDFWLTPVTLPAK